MYGQPLGACQLYENKSSRPSTARLARCHPLESTLPTNRQLMNAERPLGLFHILEWTESVGIEFSRKSWVALAVYVTPDGSYHIHLLYWHRSQKWESWVLSLSSGWATVISNQRKFVGAELSGTA